MKDSLELCQKCGNHHQGQCSYEISYFIYYPQSQHNLPKNVQLVGQWYRWQNHQRQTYYEVGSNVPTGKFQYKFYVDGNWVYCKQSPKVPDPYGSYNNIVQVLPKKALLQYIPKKDIKLSSSLKMKNLKLIGSWDNWNSQISMELTYNNLKGCYQNIVYLDLLPNVTHQFKFKCQNQYFTDQKYPTIQNQFGGYNNRIFICSQKINTPTPTGWKPTKTNIIVNNFNCRCFEWQKIHIEQYKTALDGHSMLQIGQFIYIFGGQIRNDFTNRLTKVNIHKLNILQSQEFLPHQRAFHCAAAYGNKMIVYGGHNKAILQDYNVFDTTQKVWQSQIKIYGKFPSKRQKQTCVLYQTLLVFFGGYYCHPDFQRQHTYNDLHVLNLQNMKWIDQQSIIVNGDLPKPRFSHTSQLIHSNMYIFGGKNVTNQKGKSHHINYNDIWVMNLQNVSNLHWQQLKPKGTPPIPRHGHTMNALNNYLIIFGGQGDKRQKFGDVIVFDSQKIQWIYPLISCKKPDHKPLPRAYHGAASINNQSIVIFGGKSTNHRNTSFYVLKPSNINKLQLDADIQQQQQYQNSCQYTSSDLSKQNSQCSNGFSKHHSSTRSTI